VAKSGHIRQQAKLGDGFAKWNSCCSYRFVCYLVALFNWYCCCDLLHLSCVELYAIRTPVRFHRVPEGNVHWERVSRDVGGVGPRRPTWEQYSGI
jgi:hypothetical protein